MVSAIDLIFLLVACDGGADTAADLEDVYVHLQDANNYAYTGQIDVPEYTTAEHVDLTIDWSALTRDLQCHDLDPVADIDNVAVVWFANLSHADVEAGLSDGTLGQMQMSGIVNVEPGDRTSVQLAEMTFFGTPFDTVGQYGADAGTFVLVLTSGTVPGVGARMTAFLVPDPGSTADGVALVDDCDMLDLDVDLTSLTPVDVPWNAKSWAFDWTDITLDSRGNAFKSGELDVLEVARYTQHSVADLEADFLDLELDADDLWTESLTGGTNASLGGLVDADGHGFESFDVGATYILALRCTQCSNPAPPFLTVLTPYAAH